MNVLITGATGYIGGAVATAVAAAGHDVHGLGNSDEAMALIRSRGWAAVSGDLRDGARLQELAGGFDAVIHAANTGGADAARVDAVATRAFLRGLASGGGTLVYTSGAWVVGNGDSDETSPADPPALVAWRADLEREIVAAAPAVRAVVVRPGVVYGNGGGIPGMVARGDVPVVDDGRQCWPLVHMDDLADLYLRALGAPAGVILHGVAHTMSMRDLAMLAAAGRAVPLPAPISLAEARARFGQFADALALDQRVSAWRTRSLLGWQPGAPSPAEELLVGSYAALHGSIQPEAAMAS